MANTIYVGGLAPQATEGELSRLLQPYGTVRSIVLPRSVVTGQAAGYAFVEMADEAVDLDVVQAINGAELNARELRAELIVSTEVGTTPRGLSGPARVATVQAAELTWERLEAWLKANAEAILYSLYPVALDEEIRHAEEALGVTFPPDVRVAYGRHNGQSSVALFPNGFKYCSLLDVVEIRNCQTRTAEQIKDVEYWHPNWIPLTDNGMGEYHFVNLNATDPDYGRIFWWNQAGDPCPIAENFTEMVAELAEGLETSHYVVEEHGIAEASANWI